jgi:hypothetical protein
MIAFDVNVTKFGARRPEASCTCIRFSRSLVVSFDSVFLLSTFSAAANRRVYIIAGAWKTERVATKTLEDQCFQGRSLPVE